jgi:CubicO group peptidase (beta-lactamase class C family)
MPAHREFSRWCAAIQTLKKGAIFMSVHSISRRECLHGTAAALTLTSVPALARTGKPEAIRAAEAVASGIMSASPIPAMSLAVYREDAIVWTQAFGVADLELKVAATPKMKFRIGSVSKVITAAAAARLVERQVVSLDESISTYLPILPAAHRQTTLRQLLGHRGGVRHYIERDDDSRSPGGTIDQRTYRSMAEALEIFINDPLIGVPGTSYNYSTFGFVLASAVLEAAARKPFLKIVNDEVTQILGLRDMEADIPLNLVVNRVRPYQMGKSYQALDPNIHGDIVNAPSINPAYKWAGGGFVATAADLASFGGSLLTPGYLKQQTLDTMFTAQVPASGPNAPAVGLAWRIDQDGQQRRRFHHAGNIAGGRAAIVIYPDIKLVFSLTTNLGGIPNDVLTPAGLVATAFST